MLGSHLTVIARVGCSFKNKEKVEMNKKQKQDVIGKLENKNKEGQVHFIPSLLSNLATIQVPGHPKSPPAQHKEVTRSYLHLAALACLE